MATITLGSNISSLRAERQVGQSSNRVNRLYEQLASGLRITRGSDDPAGLAVSSSLNVETRIFTQAIRNVNDALSMVSVAEAALTELNNILIRQKELSVQAANGVLSVKQRQSLNQEANTLVDEFNRIVRSVEFNKLALFDPTRSDISIQAGSERLSAISFELAGSLARTVGDGTFASINQFSTGNDSFIIGTADLNNDGNIDLLSFLNDGSFTVTTYLGDGTGDFTQHSSATAAGGRYLIGDFTGNGHYDVLTVGATISLLPGNGDGTFGAAINSSVGVNSSDAIFGDFNGDGVLDIAATNDGTGTLYLFYGQGDGTFSAGGSYAAGVSPVSLSSGDFNGDGIADIVVANMDQSTISIFLGTGSGMANEISLPALNGSAWKVIAMDANGDGYGDVVVRSGGSNVIELMLSNGDGTFNRGVNQNEITELTFSAASTISDSTWFYISPSSSLQNYVWFRKDGVGIDPAFFEWDLDPSDGIRVDILSTDSADQVAAKVKAALDGAGGFNTALEPGGKLIATTTGIGNVTDAYDSGDPTGVKINIRQQGNSGVIASGGLEGVADFNNDGLMDLLVSNYNSSQTNVLFGNGSGGFSQEITLGNYLGNGRVHINDFNHDGVLDIIAGDWFGGDHIVFAGNTERVTTIAYLNLTKASSAREAMAEIDASMVRLSRELGAVGSARSRLSTAADVVSVARENFAAANSRIMDVDIAHASAHLIKDSIVQEASVAVLAQANLQPELALQLLKN